MCVTWMVRPPGFEFPDRTHSTSRVTGGLLEYWQADVLDQAGLRPHTHINLWTASLGLCKVVAQ